MLNDISTFIATNWGLSGQLTDISASGLSGSIIYTLENGDGKFVLKGYPPKISTVNVQVVHDLLLSLAAQNFKQVPHLIKMQNGQTTVLADARNWEILTFMAGDQLAADATPAGLKSIAEALANFHLLSLKLGNDGRARVPNVVDKQKLLANSNYLDGLDVAKVRLLKEYNYYDLFAEFLARIPEIYTKYLDIDWPGLWPKLPQSFIHSDLSKKNLLFQGDKVSAIIDFESTKFGARIWDIARVPIEFTDGNKDAIALFVETYHAVNPLTDTERKFLPNWIQCLNIGVNCWALTHFVDRHLETKSENSAYLVKRIEKALQLYSY